MNLLKFVQEYHIPRLTTTAISKRHKIAVVIVRPYIPPDPNGLHFEIYCKHKMMLHIPFRDIHSLKDTHELFASAYVQYLTSERIPSCLEDDVQRVLQTTQDEDDDNDNVPDSSMQLPNRLTEEWMILCNQHPVPHQVNNSENWTLMSQNYPNLEEVHRFIITAKENPQTSTTNVSIPLAVNLHLLQGSQKEVYLKVKQHFLSSALQPLKLIISGTAANPF